MLANKSVKIVCHPVVLSRMQLRNVIVTQWFRRPHCLVRRPVLSVFIHLLSVGCVCSYYGIRFWAQRNKLNQRIYRLLLERKNTLKQGRIGCFSTSKVYCAYSNSGKNVKITETVAMVVTKHPAKF